MRFLNPIVAFILVWIMLSFSCSPKYVSWENHDPFEDEEEKVKIVKVKSKEQKSHKADRVVAEKVKEIVELPDIYEVSCDISLEDADLMLSSALEEKNYKIIKVSHVTKGMKEQGRTDFWEDMNIYMVCRLSDGYYVLRHNPWLVGMCPIRIYTYRNEDGKLVIGMFRPSLTAKWMGNPDMKALDVLKTYDKELKEVIDSVCQE